MATVAACFTPMSKRYTAFYFPSVSAVIIFTFRKNAGNLSGSHNIFPIRFLFPRIFEFSKFFSHVLLLKQKFIPIIRLRCRFFPIAAKTNPFYSHGHFVLIWLFPWTSS